MSGRLMKLKDPISSMTHYIGGILAFLFGIPLMIKGFLVSPVYGISAIIFVIGMLCLYNASGTYHAIKAKGRLARVLKKLDHSMIFVLIASSYTPVCLVALHNIKGYILLSAAWILALIGVILKMFVVYHPRWISSVIYISMGWMCVVLIGDLFISLSTTAFAWLVAGGVMYTIGGIIYALKLKAFNSKHRLWGSHEIFHIFVMLGSACHFVTMYNL